MKKIKKLSPSGNRRRALVYILLTAIIILAAGVIIFSMQKEEATPASQQGGGILAVPIAMYDFGSVSLNEGTVSTEVPLVNIGNKDLTIFFLNTSCGCTTARIINNGQKGPVFGMASHKTSPTDWQTTIKPGQQATLRIFYDPQVHPGFRGAATRQITIVSNSTQGGTETIRIKVNQID